MPATPLPQLADRYPEVSRSERDVQGRRQERRQHAARRSHQVKLGFLVGTKWRERERVWRWRAGKWNHTLLITVTPITFLPTPPSPTPLMCRAPLEDKKPPIKSRFTDSGGGGVGVVRKGRGAGLLGEEFTVVPLEEEPNLVSEEQEELLGISKYYIYITCYILQCVCVYKCICKRNERCESMMSLKPPVAECKMICNKRLTERCCLLMQPLQNRTQHICAGGVLRAHYLIRHRAARVHFNSVCRMLCTLPSPTSCNAMCQTCPRYI